MISGRNISKSYGKLQALQNVSIACNSGEICGLVGANGAGKSTLFKILLGLVSADSGTITLQGEGAKKIGGIIEKPSLYPYLSARENLRVFAKMQNAAADNKAIDEALLQVGLSLDREDPSRNYSMGMKQRLGIAVALLNKPSCLLLDEPFSGLDPVGIQALKKLIVSLAKDHGMAILISSHIVEVLSTLCSKLFVIHNGEILQQGPTQAILSKCVKSYTLCGNELQKVSFLKEYSAAAHSNCITIPASATEISEIIFKLSEQGIAITSCTPRLDVAQLFKATAV
ncbi:ABC transporter ATP-binding protein [Aequorivita flava]|uniref:ABC transporter ATP-binding protein n=1 Tax=Aequorivita flava TaxID=3114371 RepID=A0AB35YPX2_9FLAO